MVVFAKKIKIIFKFWMYQLLLHCCTCKVETYGVQRKCGTETCKPKSPFPFMLLGFYFTYPNNEKGGWYIQNLKIILIVLVRPQKFVFFYIFLNFLYRQM